ncbi:MAG: 4Fe-4S dicluster domain-containing protein [Promethearchaeota archaeon]|nr:MAG: 4Fe-4S dicluster domain-containing protein [Candidatus Lokiarchaeota archaeon]
MEDQDIYEQLMDHLTLLAMSYSPRKELLQILKENFSPEEIKVVLALPNKVIPMQGVKISEISKNLNLSLDQLEKIIRNLSARGLIFSSKSEKDGEIRYAINQPGYGFPQTFFWKNEVNPYSKSMAKQILKYFDNQVTKEVFCPTPIPFRYVPVDETIEPDIQSVLPYQVMSNIIKNAKVIAVANCSCRVIGKLMGRECGHPLEVCMKFNELAEYIIEKGFAREISKEEALKINKQASEAGLVHFADNSIDNVQQNCNCCGCSCWNLGRIKRRKLPRDEVIATYFIRETIQEECIGCGNCIDICPADAVHLQNNYAQVEKDWCIGCGVCVSKCPNDAIRIVLRDDLKNKIPEETFERLHQKILENRG